VNLQRQRLWADANRMAREAVAISRRIGHDQLRASAMVNLANGLWYAGEREDARDYAEEALAALAGNGRALRHSHYGMIALLTDLSEMAAAAGDIASAADRARAAVASAVGLASTPVLALTLVICVQVLLAEDRPLAAARYLGALQAYREATPHSLIALVVGPEQLDQLWDEAFGAAGASATAALTEGRHLTVEDAAEEIVQFLGANEIAA
jgi:hypothetical protein